MDDGWNGPGTADATVASFWLELFTETVRGMSRVRNVKGESFPPGSTLCW